LGLSLKVLVDGPVISERFLIDRRDFLAKEPLFPLREGRVHIENEIVETRIFEDARVSTAIRQEEDREYGDVVAEVARPLGDYRSEAVPR
jgi:hypothetical protein